MGLVLLNKANFNLDASGDLSVAEDRLDSTFLRKLHDSSHVHLSDALSYKQCLAYSPKFANIPFLRTNDAL